MGRCFLIPRPGAAALPVLLCAAWLAVGRSAVAEGPGALGGGSGAAPRSLRRRLVQEPPSQLPVVGLWHEPSPLRLRLVLCTLFFSNTKEELEISFPSNPEYAPVRTRVSADIGEAFEYNFPSMPDPPPTSVNLRAIGNDAICIQAMQLNGVNLASGTLQFPVWLDDPCNAQHRYYGVSCYGDGVWADFVLPTTTTSTETTSTLTSSTSTSTVTSSTSTFSTITSSTSSSTPTRSSTTSTTSTATTTTWTRTSTATSTTTPLPTPVPLPVPLPMLGPLVTTTSTTRTVTTTTTTTPSEAEAMEAAMAPDVFGDAFEAQLDLSLQKDSLDTEKKQQLEGDIADIVAVYVGISSPSSVSCELVPEQNEELDLSSGKPQAPKTAELDFVVEGINYDALVADAAWEAAFREAVLNQTLWSVSDGVTREMVQISLSRGSVRVKVDVTPTGASGVTANDVVSNLAAQTHDFVAAVTASITAYAGASKAATGTVSIDEAKMHVGPKANTKAILSFDVQRGSPYTAYDMHKAMEDPKRRWILNMLLAHGREWALKNYDPDATEQQERDWRFCSQRSVVCCVNSVVYSIIHNAGVAKAYKWYFVTSMLLLVLVLVTLIRALKEHGFLSFLLTKNTTLDERIRGLVVIPLLFIGDVFQAVFYLIKSVEKYKMLEKSCSNAVALARACPPSPWALCFEIAVFCVALLVPLAYVIRPLTRRWQADIAAERAAAAGREKELVVDNISAELGPGSRVDIIWHDDWLTGTIKGDRQGQNGEKVFKVHCDVDNEDIYTYTFDYCVRPRAPPSILQQRHVMPLESVLRRCFLFAFMEVRSTDKASPLHRFLIVAMNCALSFAVVNTCFFALQRYEVPGKLAAWLPYKLVMELVVAAVVKAVFAMAMASGSLGDSRFYGRRAMFGIACVVVVTGFNCYLWSIIGGAVETFVDWRDMSARMRVLDITIGAGLVNFMLSPLVFTLQLLVASVYLYEPWVRQKVLRVVYLRKPEQVEELLDALGRDYHGHGDRSTWVLGGRPEVDGKPVRLAALDRAGASPLSPGGTALKTARSLERKDDGAEELLFGAESSDSEEEELDEVTPSADAPVLVRLKNTGASRTQALLVKVLDLVFSVDADLPVVRYHAADAMVSSADLMAGGATSDEDNGKRSGDGA